MNAKRNKIITAILSAVLATLSGLTMTGQIQKVFSFNGNHSEIAFAIVTLFMAFVLLTFAFGEESKDSGKKLKDL
jgi:ribose/xylose/arabinose/galactoside ABC-type transport system permease subunit